VKHDLAGSGHNEAEEETTPWVAGELTAIGGAEEIGLTIRVVRAGDEPYVRPAS